MILKALKSEIFNLMIFIPDAWEFTWTQLISSSELRLFCLVVEAGESETKCEKMLLSVNNKEPCPDV